jgi:hypothetical protein
MVLFSYYKGLPLALSNFSNAFLFCAKNFVKKNWPNLSTQFKVIQSKEGGGHCLPIVTLGVDNLKRIKIDFLLFTDSAFKKIKLLQESALEHHPSSVSCPTPARRRHRTTFTQVGSKQSFFNL